jgi:hypothetical protein
VVALRKKTTYPEKIERSQSVMIGWVNVGSLAECPIYIFFW